MRTIVNWANRRAGRLTTLGMGAVALWNWRLWQKDRALLERLRARVPEPVTLKSIPRVSVLVAAWNESATLRDHIESYLSLRYPDKELILCAGGEDGSHGIASKYAGDRVVVLEQFPGEGKQGALRRCLARSTGEVLFLADADCVITDEAFERTLEPILNGEEQVTSGACVPRHSQLSISSVRQRWLQEVYVRARSPRYANGLLGTNAAVTRGSLDAAGSFAAQLRIGTDYHLAKMLLSKGFRIRNVPDSVVETAYPQNFASYRRQQSRWLRNILTHGVKFGDSREIAKCVLPYSLGAFMVAGPALARLLGRWILVCWLWAWLHALLSRSRYLIFAIRLSGMRITLCDWLALPIHTAEDFLVWGLSLVDILSSGRRQRW